MAEPAAVVKELRDGAFQLAAAGDDAVLDGLAAALDLWRGESGFAARAARTLHAESGQSEAMLRFGLDRMVAAHSREALKRWLTDARVEAARLAAARHPEGEPPVLATLRGPTVVAQILAGNVAGLAVPAALEALLARSAVLLKPASGDPVTAALWLESLRRAAPLLAGAVAVEPWTGGDRKTEDPVFESVDYVVASGGAEMAVSLGRRLHTPHVIYGPRISVGVVGMAWMQAPETWWEEATREIVLWDQAGCLSPRILFVAGDPRRFAARLAEALSGWETRWPARPRTPEEASAIHQFRAPYEMAAPTSAGCVSPGDTTWTVVWDEDPSLDAGPPARVVRVAHRPSRRAMKELLERNRDRVQGVGLAHLARNELDWKRAAAAAEIPWIGPLTSIQAPPAGWRADGRSGLASLLAEGVVAAHNSP